MDHRALTAIFGALEARRSGKLDPVRMSGADLQGAHLLRADLVEAELEETKLDHATLSGARLGRARLLGASLRRAHLDAADFTEADLSEADLEGARVRGTVFSRAKLCGANLRGWAGVPDSLVGAQIDKAACDRSGLGDRAVIELFRSGAEIVDLTEFSDDVQRGCAHRSEGLDVLTEEQILGAEAAVRKARLDVDLTIPPASRRGTEMQRLSVAAAAGAGADSAPPVSLRRAAPLPDDLLMLAGVVVPPAPAEEEVVCGATLVRKLGKGTSGTVWLGRTENGGEVAVKVFDMSLHATGLLLHAFRRGVKTMNRLILDDASEGMVGVRCVATSQLAFSMTYMRNGNLTALPPEWPVPTRVQFFIDLCKIVHRFHEAGVLHRCLRPSNVLLSDDLDPIVTDHNMVDLPTACGEVPQPGGYAVYAAPEEVLDLSTMSPTADIYSLGRILTFLLLGKHPSGPLEEVPALEALADQPVGLVRIARKCTLRDPAVRYQVVPELIKDLESYEDGLTVGVGAGALETNFMPYRVSNLPLAGVVEEDALEAAVAPRPKRPRPAPVIAEPAVHPAGPMAWVGAMMLVGAAALIAVTPIPGEELRLAVNLAAALAGGLLGFSLLRRAGSSKRARLAFGFSAAAALYMLQPGDLADLRIRVTLERASSEERGAAVAHLARRGQRDFSELDLSAADLSRRELTATSFRGASLKSTRLDEATLTEAEFEGADLTEASALGASFRGSNPYQATGWDTVRCDEYTVMPEGWLCGAGVPVAIQAEPR